MAGNDRGLAEEPVAATEAQVLPPSPPDEGGLGAGANGDVGGVGSGDDQCMGGDGGDDLAGGDGDENGLEYEAHPTAASDADEPSGGGKFSSSSSSSSSSRAAPVSKKS